MNILYNDSEITVAVKPAGLVSEADCPDSFPDILAVHLERSGEKHVKLFTVHRLDQKTEGIIVYAKNTSAAAELSAQITDKKWTKIYTAVLCGIPEKESDTLCDLLYFDRMCGKAFVVDRERRGVKSASLTYKIIKISDDRKQCVISVELHTGRTHQIRVQFASRKLPICGDRKYGAPAEFGNTLSLCASSLSFPHPKSGEQMSFNIKPSGFSID